MTSTVEFFLPMGCRRKTKPGGYGSQTSEPPNRLASPPRGGIGVQPQHGDDATTKRRKSPPPPSSSSLALQSPHKFPSPLSLPASRRESKHRPGTNSSPALAISSDSFFPLPRSRALPDAEPWILTHISRTSAPRVSRGSGRSTDSRRLAGG